MDTVDHLVTGFLKVNHSHGKTIPSGTLHRGLKQRTAYENVSTPLTSKGILRVGGNAQFSASPRNWIQGELWPLPADESA